jgi:S-adenosylmethionine hydrolase
MPNVYKKKDCPQCNKEHRQRGLYCSISCANASRIHTEVTKQKISKSINEYTKTPEGVANAHIASRMRVQVGINNEKVKNNEYIPVEDDWMIEIPIEDEDKDNIRW